MVVIKHSASEEFWQSPGQTLQISKLCQGKPEKLERPKDACTIRRKKRLDNHTELVQNVYNLRSPFC